MHAILKFDNGLIKIIAHDTTMKIPIFNTIYANSDKTIRSGDLNINLLNNLNHLEKSWVYSQYDSTVMGDTVKEPGQATGIVKLHDSQKVIGASTDCNPLYIRINPELGMIYTVAEAYRNLIASNIKPMAITNNLNFASPLDPNIMGEIVLSVNGLKISASQLDTPIVSGNVSLYNQTNDAPINPTPVIGMVGSNPNINKIVSNKFQSEGDFIISIGENIDPHKSPYFLQDQKIVEDAVSESLSELAEAGITGNAISPFLLKKVSEASGGLTLEANVDLILNNVQVAGEVATQMAND